ncbi:putative short chain dehydrogenase [Paraphysoderma sedebokerense]|nr:putative short chain dehydrogenase [Paraphysoderma sedebokerense]
MSDKTVLITGANRGIGLAFVNYYLSSGYNVIAAARNPESSSELKSLPVKLLKLDVSSEPSITKAAEELKNYTVDLLINNAGILHRDDLQAASSEQIMAQFATNSLGPLLVTKAFLPHLCKSTHGGNIVKVINITSRMGSIEDNTSGGYYGYRASKAALNQITKSLAIDLKPSKIAVLALHPGMIATDMTGGRGDMGPKEAVECMVKCIEKLNLESSGEFWHRDGYKLPY